MKIDQIKRNFCFVNGSEKITLDDINPTLSNEDILNHFSNLYPELTTAKIVDLGFVDGENKIEFRTIAGTKG
ncbi:PRTRC system protein C [Tenacibaculum sp. MAR_2009_124]|uniref:PRTRC system protein C n=1 Tax=Tenacibaculum sp. MAR_2009_124 TaxID=1250059 RepID=UPI000896B654|nr:PRTRC system protein C [Tenacibaculum sp. MAR_2009_124]SEC68041.1 PRTRC system protein C [Tenacibaculum sp. MAR_2009_124]